MIPTQTSDDSEDQINEFTIVKEADLPTKTYYMHLARNVVRNKIDGKNAMKQVIFKILQTERYRHNKVYSNNYGVEFDDLIGADPLYAKPEIERRIKEALTWDERITNVTNFNFELKKNVIAVTFTAQTIFGDIQESVNVNI